MVNYQQLNDNLERIGGAYAQFQARVTPADPGYVRGQARFATMVERALQNAGIDGAYIPMIMGEFQTKGIPMNEPDRVARILYAGGVCNDHLGASTQLGLQGNHQVADVVANDGRVTRRVVNEVGNRLGNEAARLRRGIIHETHGQGRMTRRAIDENRRAVTNALDQYGQENREAFDIVQNTTDGTYAAVGNLGRQVTALDGRVTALQTDTTNQYNTLNTGVTAANAGIGRLEAAMARVNPTRSKWQTAAIGTAAALALVAAGAMARGCGAAPAVVPPLPAPPAKVDNSSQSAVNQQPQLIYVDQRTLRQGVQYTDNLHMNSGIQGGIQSLEGKKDVAPEGKSVPPVSVPVDPKVEPKDKPVQPVKDVFMPFDEPVNELCSSIRAYRGMVNGVKGYKLDLLWTDAEGDLFAIKHPLSDRTDGAFDYVIVRPTDVVGDVNNKYRVFDRGVRLEIGQKTRFVDADGVNSPEVNLEAVLMRLDGKREGKQ